MKWKVEYITNESVNILIDDSNLPDMNKEAVGIGFPVSLAERIVKLHNEEVISLLGKIVSL